MKKKQKHDVAWNQTFEGGFSKNGDVVRVESGKGMIEGREQAMIEDTPSVIFEVTTSKRGKRLWKEDANSHPKDVTDCDQTNSVPWQAKQSAVHVSLASENVPL